MKTEFSKRSRETRALLNPAFCGEIIRNTIKEYESHDPKGLPFTLVFFILPLILHQDSFLKIRHSLVGQFFSWLDTKVSQTLDFDERVKLLRKITMESIAFLSYFNTVQIKDGRLKTIEFDLSLASKNYSSYMVQYQNKAIQIGRWFGETTSIHTIYMMLGVKP